MNIGLDVLIATKAYVNEIFRAMQSYREFRQIISCINAADGYLDNII